MADKKVKKQVKKAEKKEEQLIRFLIRDFYEIKILLKLVLDAEKVKAAGNQKELKSKIEKIYKKLRSGIFGSEERVEYRMARCFKQMEHLVMGLEPILARVLPGEVKEINTLLKEGEVYNADLEKLGARGGEIESELREAERNPAQLDKALKLIKQSFQDVQAFESIASKLLNKTKAILANLDKLNSLDLGRIYLGKYDINIFDFKAEAGFPRGKVGGYYWVKLSVDGTISQHEFRIYLSDTYLEIDPSHFSFESVHQLFEHLILSHDIIVKVREEAKGELKLLPSDAGDKVASTVFYILQSDPKWAGQLEKFFEGLEIIQSRTQNRNKPSRGVVGRPGRGRIKF